MGLNQINTSNFISGHFFNQVGIILKSATCPLTEPSCPIDWGEFSEARFSADITTEWDSETV